MRIKDPELRKVFSSESEERLRNLESALDRLRDAPDDTELRAELFREAHTLKGAARMAGLEDVGSLTHMLEDSLTDFDGRAESPAFTTIHATLVAIKRLTREATGQGAGAQAVAVKAYAPKPAARVMDAPIADETLSIHGSAIDIVVALAKEAMMHRDDPARVAALAARIHEAAADLRAVPFGPVAQRLQRAAQETARARGKDVYLMVEGAEERVDKRILDDVKDALMHLLQNCIDHGVEEPQSRLASGKTATGLVCISAARDGDDIVFEVSDDGRGVDPALVLAAAIRNGVVTVEEGARLAPAKICDLIFQPGFSTKKDVTATSGRGVGLDVVRTKAQKLGGSVVIESSLGQGTVFRLRIPRSQ